MSEMVNRVREALIEANKTEGLLFSELMTLFARAAIAAMREPTESMLGAPFEFFAIAHPWASKDNRRSHWQSMIDEALK
jgi:hypothetical protein